MLSSFSSSSPLNLFLSLFLHTLTLHLSPALPLFSSFSPHFVVSLDLISHFLLSFSFHSLLSAAHFDLSCCIFFPLFQSSYLFLTYLLLVLINSQNCSSNITILLSSSSSSNLHCHLYNLSLFSFSSSFMPTFAPSLPPLFLSLYPRPLFYCFFFSCVFDCFRGSFASSSSSLCCDS